MPNNEKKRNVAFFASSFSKAYLDLALEILDKIPGKGVDVLFDFLDAAVEARRSSVVVYWRSRISFYISALVDVEIFSFIEGEFLKKVFRNEIKAIRRFEKRQRCRF